jgi:hypothetical protein
MQPTNLKLDNQPMLVPPTGPLPTNLKAPNISINLPKPPQMPPQ